MRIAYLWRRFRASLQSRRAAVWPRCTEALEALRNRLRSIVTSDRAKQWLYLVSAEVVASTTAAVLAWLLLRGR